MSRVPPDPIDCQPERLVSFSARVTVYTISVFLNLVYSYLVVRIGTKALSTLLLSLIVLIILTNIGACMVQYTDF